MGNFGRPATRPAKMMDGFYIEVANKGSKIKGVKIRNESRDAMETAAREYSKNKEVTILGEYKNETWVNGKTG
ncbi:MAG TPA: hypothetical protein PLD84_11745 [Chitinophagales bacterium]|nr:hypothetical protein [Chitinophagales bacterium]